MNDFIGLLKYIHWCYRGIRDKDRRTKMMKFETNDCLTIEHNGDLYPHQMIYLIKVEAKYSGLFSMMNNIVSALVVADRYGLIPVIDMGESVLYSEPSMTEEGIPLFEYYFRQPSEVRLEEIDRCSNIIYVTGYQYSFISLMQRGRDRYLQESVEIEQLASAITRFIHLNTSTEAYIEENIRAVLSGERILGVHVRGTDFKAGFNNHAVYVTTEEYIEHTQKAVKLNQYDQIFLATDEEQTITKFKAVFGDMVVWHNVYRSKENTAVGIHCSECSREMHHYKLGLEVLLDMYSLARCDALIACPSGVSFHALLNKRARGEKYEYMDIIDKGRYKSKKVSNVEVERMCVQRSKHK
ncbi:MAG: hypothetical protein K2J99_03930 [Lachnospiraceae bacterium]|nr:hypothetical protein [Lachnospiraceae bacterium]